MVRLKDKTQSTAPIHDDRFNSSMVRLKEPSDGVELFPFLFQFQYGSIKSAEWVENAPPREMFQFQYGSIKSGNV